MKKEWLASWCHAEAQRGNIKRSLPGSPANYSSGRHLVVWLCPATRCSWVVEAVIIECYTVCTVIVICESIKDRIMC